MKTIVSIYLMLHFFLSVLVEPTCNKMWGFPCVSLQSFFVFGCNACGREQTHSTVPICQRYHFFYLSPLFSTCKLTQTSPLGKLIKLLYCIVSRSTGFLAPIPISVHLDRYWRIVQVLCKLTSYPAVLSLPTYPVFSPHIRKVISSWLEALKRSIQILPDRISLMGTPLSL